MTGAIKIWNAYHAAWRKENLNVKINLSGADLSGAKLSGANLRNADLIGADLSGADLSGADLSDAKLSSADLSGADLSGADLRDADLIYMNLDSWAVYIQPDEIRIGCEQHAGSEWRDFCDDAINEMDSHALGFWRRYKPTIMAACESLNRKPPPAGRKPGQKERENSYGY